MTSKTVADVADKAVDKVELLITSAADKATDIFSAAAGVISETASKYGPEVIDAVLWVVRIDAIQYLLMGWLYLISWVILVFWVWTGFSRRGWHEKVMEQSDDGFLYLPFTIGVVIVTLFLGFRGVDRVTDVWKYTAVIEPKLYLTKQVVDVVTAKLEKATK